MGFCGPAAGQLANPLDKGGPFQTKSRGPVAAADPATAGRISPDLTGRSSSWRTYSAQALRMYLLHVGKPELEDVVWLPRHKKDA